MAYESIARRRWGWLLAASWLAIVSGCAQGDRADPSYPTEVARPAYATDGPRVLFDEAHHNRHRARTTYRPFAELLEADGYRVKRGSSRTTVDALRGVDLLVIAGAMGTNERNDDAAFLPGECTVIERWVANGGALLLITDHYPFGHAAESLGQRFGVTMTKGVVEDPEHHDPGFDPTHLTFSAAAGMLADHPILSGRGPAETVREVVTFTGQAVSAAPPAVGLLKLSATAVARPPLPNVVRNGGEVRVQVEYGPAEPAHGLAVGVALVHGRGRVVVLGEAAMLTAQLSRFDGSPFGMNVPGYDNRQLALNIVHWLTGLL